MIISYKFLYCDRNIRHLCLILASNPNERKEYLFMLVKTDSIGDNFRLFGNCNNFKYASYTGEEKRGKQFNYA